MVSNLWTEKKISYNNAFKWDIGMNVKSILNYFDSILKEFGYPSEIIIENENKSYLVCQINNDDTSKHQDLMITLYEQKLIIPKIQNISRFYDKIGSDNPTIENEFFVELKINLSLKSHLKSNPYISLELQKINNTLLFPGFGLDETTGTIFFRFTFLRPKGFMSKHTFLSIIGMILLNIDAFSPTLEQIVHEHN